MVINPRNFLFAVLIGVIAIGVSAAAVAQETEALDKIDKPQPVVP